ncbi:armadillo-type protein [Phellopilus nigrolimitatus]|nr:armadillo-type protein [Phellopilus nigrolimitatus]
MAWCPQSALVTSNSTASSKVPPAATTAPYQGLAHGGGLLQGAGQIRPGGDLLPNLQDKAESPPLAAQDPIISKTTHTFTALDALRDVLKKHLGFSCSSSWNIFPDSSTLRPSSLRPFYQRDWERCSRESRGVLATFPRNHAAFQPFPSAHPITMDAVGTLAKAVGADALRPYFPDIMAQAFAGAESENARLHEACFFFGVMSHIFGEEFAPYLPKVVPALINSLGQVEHGESDLSCLRVLSSSRQARPRRRPSLLRAYICLAMLTSTEKALEVNSAIVVKEETGADTLGTVSASTGRHLLPFVGQSALELVGLLAHYHEGILKRATESLLEITSHRTGSPVSRSTSPLHQNAKDLINHALPPLLDICEVEDDKTVASALCVGLAGTLNAVGPAFLETRLDDVCNTAYQILGQRHSASMTVPDQDKNEEPLEDQAEYVSVLISAAGDLVAALTSTLGADFVQAFQTFFPLIFRLYALSDEDAGVYSNATFTVGLLVEHSAQDYSPQYQTLLTALHPHFPVPPNSIAAKYNAPAFRGRYPYSRKTLIGDLSLGILAEGELGGQKFDVAVVRSLTNPCFFLSFCVPGQYPAVHDGLPPLLVHRSRFAALLKPGGAFLGADLTESDAPDASLGKPEFPHAIAHRNAIAGPSIHAALNAAGLEDF